MHYLVVSFVQYQNSVLIISHSCLTALLNIVRISLIYCTVLFLGDFLNIILHHIGCVEDTLAFLIEISELNTCNFNFLFKKWHSENDIYWKTSNLSTRILVFYSCKLTNLWTWTVTLIISVMRLLEELIFKHNPLLDMLLCFHNLQIWTYVKTLESLVKGICFIRLFFVLLH